MDATLRGPNKPLPPTPIDLNIEEKTEDSDEDEDGTLLISNKRNAIEQHQKSMARNIRRHNSHGSTSGGDSPSSSNQRLRLSQVGKAASIPGVFKFLIIRLIYKF